MTSAAAQQNGDWPMYSGAYHSHPFSPLRQITPANVAGLRPLWVYQPPGTGSVECTPIVVNGVMYVTSGPTSVSALDLKSGKPIWEWTRPIAASVLNLGFPRVNRGVSILDNTIYVGTLDGYLVALDARAGIERWAVHVGDNPTGHSITAAPLIVGDKVIVGISGGEAGIRGFLDAYDAKSGKQL
jgi:alcohol dehydrogenase (cytochrome c)